MLFSGAFCHIFLFVFGCKCNIYLCTLLDSYDEYERFYIFIFFIHVAENTNTDNGSGIYINFSSASTNEQLFSCQNRITDF